MCSNFVLNPPIIRAFSPGSVTLVQTDSECEKSRWKRVSERVCVCVWVCGCVCVCVCVCGCVCVGVWREAFRPSLKIESATCEITENTENAFPQYILKILKKMPFRVLKL